MISTVSQASAAKFLRDREEKIPLFDGDKPSVIKNILDPNSSAYVAKPNSFYIGASSQIVYVDPTRDINLNAIATGSGLTNVTFELGRNLGVANPRWPRIVYDIRNTSAVDDLYVAPPLFWEGELIHSLSSAANVACSSNKASFLAWRHTLTTEEFQSMVLTDEYHHQFEQADALIRQTVDTNVLTTVRPPVALPFTRIPPLTTQSFSLYILEGLINSPGFNLHMLYGDQKYLLSHRISASGNCFSNPAITEILSARLVLTGVLPNVDGSKMIRAFLEGRDRDNRNTQGDMNFSMGYHVPSVQTFQYQAIAQGGAINLPMSQLTGYMSGINIFSSPATPTVAGATTLVAGLQGLGTFYQGVRPQIIVEDFTAATVTETSSFSNGSIYGLTNYSFYEGGSLVVQTPMLSGSSPGGQLGDFEFFGSETHKSPCPKRYMQHSYIHPFSSNFMQDIRTGSCSHGVYYMSGNNTIKATAPATIATPFVISVTGFKYQETLYHWDRQKSSGCLIPVIMG